MGNKPANRLQFLVRVFDGCLYLLGFDGDQVMPSLFFVLRPAIRSNDRLMTATGSLENHSSAPYSARFCGRSTMDRFEPSKTLRVAIRANT